MKTRSYSTYVLALVGGLFAISLALKPYCAGDDCSSMGPGIMVLLLGWLGVLVGGAGLAWLGNPFLILSWFLFRAKKTGLALVSACIAVGFAASFWFQDEIMVNEAGHYKDITVYASGYWFWLSSCMVMVLGILGSFFAKASIPERESGIS
ncbi:MAG: hypothetical protein AAF206_11910 [Bacteroidota bacterium]